MTKDNSRFVAIYRNKIHVNHTSKAEVKEVIDKIDLCVKAINAGIDLNVIQRHTGLTLDEIKEMPNDQESVVEELNLRSKYMRDVIRATSGVVLKELNKNKQYVIDRLLMGDKINGVLKDLGFTGHPRVAANYVNDLVSKGYFVNKVKDYHNIRQDLQNRVPVEDIIKNYAYFISEKSIQDFIDLHNIKNVELIRKKEEVK